MTLPGVARSVAPVVVLEDVWGAAFEELALAYDVRRLPDAWADPAALAAAAAQAGALVVRNRTRVTGELLRGAGRLRIVARAGAGLDNIDVAAADAAGVVVCAGLGANAVSVAEHTLALALALAHRIPQQDRATRGGAWERTPGRELSGGTWGIVGLGATGLAVARLLAGLGMRVVGHDPGLDAGNEQVRRAGVALAGLDEVAASADVLSVHVPMTPRTRGLIDARLLGLMKPGALLISVGRGECVDEEALADALEAGRLGGAGLDVRAVEPPVPGRLERLGNVVLSPHVAGITVESQERIAGMLARDIRNVLSGRAAEYAVGRIRVVPVG